MYINDKLVFAIVLLSILFIIAFTITYKRQQQYKEALILERQEEAKVEPIPTPEEMFVGTYRFYDEDEMDDWILTVNDDGTCTIKLSKNESILWRCSWEYDEYYERYDISISSNDNPYAHNKPLHGYMPKVDGNIEYYYADWDAFDAKDPNKRAKLRKE